MRWVLVLVLVLVLSCQPPRAPCDFFAIGSPAPIAAQICTDRESENFAPENAGSGVPLGVSRKVNIEVANGGLNELVISKINIEGDLAFTVKQEPPMVVQLGTPAGVLIEFAPTEPGVRLATLRIESNAENFPLKELPLIGCAVLDAGQVCVR